MEDRQIVNQIGITSFSLLYIDMIYTFSPNWYKPQCMHFRQDSLFYCSNYLLYEYSLPSKSIVREKCLREVALEYGLNHKDIKISAIESTNSLLILGLNQPFLVLLDWESWEVVRVLEIQGFDSIQYIYPFNQGESAVLCSKQGTLLKCSLEGQDGLQRVEMRHKVSPIKAIFPIDQHHCAAFTRGTILIYNKDFSVCERVVEVSNTDTIYSVDCLREEDKVWLAFLVKNKDSHSIVTFRLVLKEEFPLQFKRRVGEIGDEVKRMEVSFHYPKKMLQKLKQHLKASLTIKLLTSDTLLITGKLGEVVTLRTALIKDGEAVTIKPYSQQEQPQPQIEVWPDSKHYKQIYGIYQHKQRLYLISTDHNLSVWTSDTVPKHLYTLRFLTAGVSSFFYSEGDPRNVFALLRDSAVRSFTPLQEGSHQLNQYWKFSKKFKIKKAVCHPSEQGVLALLTECNRLQIYDIYEDRLMKLVQVGEEVLNLSFELPSIRAPLQALLKCELKPEKLKVLSHFLKEMDNKTILLLHTKDRYILLQGLAEKEPTFLSGLRARRLQRIHENRYWDDELLLSSATKNNVLDLLLIYRKHPLVLSIPLKYQQGRILFKKGKQSRQLLVINFKGSKFTLFRSLLPESEEGCQLVGSTEVMLPNPIDFLLLSYHDWRVAVYGQRDDAIVVLQLDQLHQEKYEVGKSSEWAQVYWINTKIDSLLFYLDEYIIVATKDQTIKLIPYAQLSQQRSNHKKTGLITKLTLQ